MMKKLALCFIFIILFKSAFCQVVASKESINNEIYDVKKQPLLTIASQSDSTQRNIYYSQATNQVQGINVVSHSRQRRTMFFYDRNGSLIKAVLWLPNTDSTATVKSECYFVNGRILNKEEIAISPKNLATLFAEAKKEYWDAVEAIETSNRQ